MPHLSPVAPYEVVVFGGTGVLAMRKLLSALYQRNVEGPLTADTYLACAARWFGPTCPGLRANGLVTACSRVARSSRRRGWTVRPYETEAQGIADAAADDGRRCRLVPGARAVRSGAGRWRTGARVQRGHPHLPERN
jgi:hypothetical protein